MERHENQGQTRGVSGDHIGSGIGVVRHSRAGNGPNDRLSSRVARSR